MIELEKVGKEFGGRRRGLFGPRSPGIRALHNISFAIPSKAAFGIVGESGSGKSTLGRILCGLTQPTDGTLTLEGKPLEDWIAGNQQAFRRTIQIVFQDPASSLNPRMRIGSTLEQPLIHLAGIRDRQERIARMKQLLDQTGVPKNALERYPHEFSGGQCQRIGIARALAADPSILILDEAVSALDVSVQAQILELLASLRRELDLTLIFISHDLAVVRHLCDQLAVLKSGQLMETGGTEQIFEAPKTDYTRNLVESAPRLILG